MRDKIIEVLKTIEDPDLFIDIWFLGLIYEIDFNEVDGATAIKMTFTTPLCPSGPDLVNQVHEKTLSVPEVSSVKVEVTFDPPWQASDEVKGLLGIN